MSGSLQEHLVTLPYKDLRGMATRLGLRQRQQGRKPEWIVRIEAGWQSMTQRGPWLAALSVAAQGAVVRLLQAQQIPAQLFWAEYGRVGQVTAKQAWTPAPWQAPAN